MQVDAILPAGGRIRGAFAAEAGAEVKALIELGGRTVLERTVAALRVTGRVLRIVVIGPAEVAAHPAARAADVVLPAGASSPTNILRGLEWLREARGGSLPERVLALTTDLPFVTPQAITSFLDACPPDAAICLPLIRRQDFEARFPGLSIEYVRLPDGELTMGCAFLVRPATIIDNRAILERAFAARKSQIAMVRLLGPMFILRFVTRRLTIAHIRRRCFELLGYDGVPIPGAAPELAFDIDRPEEYRYARLNLPPDRGQAP
jgi:molybdopterin-guanine dinucleotide biosynthesis protein A